MSYIILLASSVSQSSLSRKKTYLPWATLSPALRAADTPLLGWSRTTARESLFSNALNNDKVSSVEPSLTKINSTFNSSDCI